METENGDTMLPAEEDSERGEELATQYLGQLCSQAQRSLTSTNESGVLMAESFVKERGMLNGVPSGATDGKVPDVSEFLGDVRQRHPRLSALFNTLTMGAVTSGSRATPTETFLRKSASSEALNSVRLMSGFPDFFDDPAVWWFRKTLAHGELSTTYQILFMLIVFIDLVFVVFETNATAAGEEVEPWVSVSIRGVMCFYVLEILVRIYIHQIHFFGHWQNLFDSSIVFLDVIILTVGVNIGTVTDSGRADGEFVPSLSLLRCARLAQLARTYKALNFFPELSLMMRGLLGALRSVVWGILFLAFLFAVFGIVGVQVIHPLNLRMLAATSTDCERCERAYSTVYQCMITFMQQFVAGDSWGQLTIPIIEMFPASIIFFGMLLVLSNLLFLNLILGVILDAAYIARRGTDEEIAKEKERSLMQARQEILGVCAALDLDGSGSLSKEEIMDGATSMPAFKSCLQAMEVGEEDMDVMCSILDENGSGEVDYSEFADGLHKMKTSDVHTMLVFIKQYVKEIRVSIVADVAAKLQELESHLKPIAAVNMTDLARRVERRQTQKASSFSGRLPVPSDSHVLTSGSSESSLLPLAEAPRTPPAMSADCDEECAIMALEAAAVAAPGDCVSGMTAAELACTAVVPTGSLQYLGSPATVAAQRPLEASMLGSLQSSQTAGGAMGDRATSAGRAVVKVNL